MMNGIDRGIELIIFDLDGTLIDSRMDIANSLNYTLKELGLKPVTIKAVEAHIGIGVRGLIKDIIKKDDKRLVDRAFNTFLKYYSRHLLDNTHLYPSVEEVLTGLKNKKKALITNKPIELSLKILEGLGIRGCFDIILGGDSLEVKKPSPLPLLKTIEELSTPKSKTLMVGDSRIDIEAGISAGVLTCGVTYGYGNRSELIEAGADLTIDDLGALKRLLNED